MSDIPVVHVPPLPRETGIEAGSSSGPSNVWAVDIPRQRRPSPAMLAALGVVAGIGAMLLGAAAVVAAGRDDVASPRQAAPVVSQRAGSGVPAVERRLLALLAKPSTQRVVFRNSGGTLLLAVGTGGRAAILIRGFKPAAPGQPYRAWILAPGHPPVRAAAFQGTERAVFLSSSVGSKASVVVSSGQRVPLRAAGDAVAATRV